MHDDSENERLFAEYCMQAFGAHTSQLATQLMCERALFQKVIARHAVLYQESPTLFNRKKRRELGRLTTEKTRLEGLTRNLAATLESLKEFQSFRAQYKEICALPRVERLRVNQAERRLVVETDVLFGRDNDGLWHRVGAYIIHINATGPFEEDLNSERFRWINRSGAVLVRHPNGNEEKIMTSFGADKHGVRSCLGTAKGLLREALKRGDFVTLASVLVRFPECPGQYNLITRWPFVEVDEVPEWYRAQFR